MLKFYSETCVTWLVKFRYCHHFVVACKLFAHFNIFVWVVVGHDHMIVGFRILFRHGLLYTTVCDKVYLWLAAGQWFSPGTLVSSTNKTDRHDIVEILLKVALNTINQTKPTSMLIYRPVAVIFQGWFDRFKCEIALWTVAWI
jgi:hypothetical protein